MANPVILTVDDEPQVLNAVQRDLLQHYQGEYRIIKAASGAEALHVTGQLAQRGDAVALFLVDHRMPQMTGVEFLREASRHFPRACKVLLTAYADTDAAIASINDIGLDYYLMKPWDPPEQHMYPVLDDLLDEWASTVRPPYDGIRVAGTLWSAASHATKDFLARNRIPYRWLDIEKDAEARALVETVHNERPQLPVVFFPDGTVLVAPENRALAQAVGLRTAAAERSYDVIVVGAGPAGLGAGVYAASEGLSTLMIDMAATGGQAGTSSRIENYLGFPNGVSGAELARRATTQAERLGAEILTAQRVVGLRVEDPYRIVVLEDGTELTCRALILATGVTVRRLDVPGIERLTGAGVYYGAATSEAAHYAGESVLVVGGANSAGQGAMFLAGHAAKVTMVVRGDSLAASMSRYLIDQIEAQPNIEIRTRTTVESVDGDERLEQVTLRSDSGDLETVSAAALFIFIGAQPHTDFVRDIVACDDLGFILTGEDLPRKGRRPTNWRLERDPYLLETCVPGIFAAGDVQHGAMRRVASAVGQGAAAVRLVHEYLKTV